jgi:hypothetical protein
VTVCQWFDIKTTGMVSPILASKPVASVSPDLASKPVASVSPGLASNPVVEDFSVWTSKLAATVW